MSCRHFNEAFPGSGVGVFGGREGLVYISLLCFSLFGEGTAGWKTTRLGDGCCKDFFVCGWGGGGLGIGDIWIRELG